MLSLLILGLSVPASLLNNSDWIEASSPADVAARYGDRLVFDVYRKGKKIGESITRFERNGEKLMVNTELDLRVKFLFFTAYKLDMTSHELWDTRGLLKLSSDIDNNGDDVDIVAQRSNDGYVWQCYEGDAHQVPATVDVFPTNHWHPGVLLKNQLFNTLTGHMIDVSVSSAGFETLETASGPIRAERFVYDWELDETESWYDAEGRWVGLRFSAKDGSKITYVCQNCGNETL